ncbi:3410_t:CDS:1, partial [Paraglomus brasilianum]
KKSRVLINSLPAIEGDPEEIPEQRKHGKDHKEKKLIWFNKWRDTFINENTANYNID